MTIPHLDLQIEYLQAVQAGKRMEWRWKWGVMNWNDWVPSETAHPRWLVNELYEIREVTRQQYIPECDVPRALEVAPEDAVMVWTISPFWKDGVYQFPWVGSEYTHIIALENGCLWATEADARAAWEAMSARRERL